MRAGIRRLCAQRLADERRGAAARRAALDRTIQTGPVAPLPEKPNEQHYELPVEFMALALGPALKYSCAWYETGGETLAQAEEAMLALTCARADLRDELDILELGCGWGSLTLWMAQRYPRARITAVSNSAPQRVFILAEAARRGLTNVQVLTADMNHFHPDGCFDRVVSVEMFEHMRNYPELMRRVHSWLRPGGALFVHLFCHRTLAYPFEDEGGDDWMARHFFSGGLMPSESLLLECRGELLHARTWPVDGRHYERTANHWLANLQRNEVAAVRALRPVYGAEARVWYHRWRLFYMACAELFGFARGTEWGVAHYLFRRATD